MEAGERLRMSEKGLPEGRAIRHLVRSGSEPQDRVTELVEQQTAISEVLRAIASSPHDLQPIFDAILDSAARLCRADTGSLRLSEEGGLRLVAVRGDPVVVSQVWSSFPALAEKGGFATQLAASRVPTHIPEVRAGSAPTGLDRCRTAGRECFSIRPGPCAALAPESCRCMRKAAQRPGQARDGD